MTMVKFMTVIAMANDGDQPVGDVNLAEQSQMVAYRLIGLLYIGFW